MPCESLGRFCDHRLHLIGCGPVEGNYGLGMGHYGLTLDALGLDDAQMVVEMGRGW